MSLCELRKWPFLSQIFHKPDNVAVKTFELPKQLFWSRLLPQQLRSFPKPPGNNPVILLKFLSDALKIVSKVTQIWPMKWRSRQGGSSSSLKTWVWLPPPPTPDPHGGERKPTPAHCTLTSTHTSAHVHPHPYLHHYPHPSPHSHPHPYALTFFNHQTPTHI